MPPKTGLPSSTLYVFAYRNVHPRTMLCLLRDARAWPKLDIRWAGNDALISRTRSIVATEFLASGNDVLLMVDHDMLWDAGALQRLAQGALEKGVVGGVYGQRGFGVPLPIRVLEDADIDIPSDRYVECAYVSAGFLGINRAVLESLSFNLPKTAQLQPFFQPMVAGDEYLSEDWSFPLDPETLVLDSAFCWRPLCTYRVGDTVVGVSDPVMGTRRYVNATVENVIQKALPVWRIVTSEGDFITTAEHPWLTKRSWRKRVGYHADATYPPHPCKWAWVPTAEIRPGDKLARAMPLEPNPSVHSEDYCMGYLQGIMHGDGTVSREANRGALYMCDTEPLYRTASILASIGADVRWQPPREPQSERHRPLYGFHLPKATAQLVDDIMGYEGGETVGFAKGYLAGIYDAEGHYDGATADITQRNEAIRHRILHMGQLAGFDFRVDPKRLRLTGMNNVHRFWMAVQPAIQRKMHLNGQSGSLEATHRPVIVEAVEPLNITREVHCLVTSSGTFLANGVITHNCERVRTMLGFRVYADLLPVLGHVGEHMYRAVDTLTQEPPPNTLTMRLKAWHPHA